MQVLGFKDNWRGLRRRGYGREIPVVLQTEVASFHMVPSRDLGVVVASARLHD